MRAWWLPVAAAVVVLTGCGQAAEPSPPASPAPSPATTSSAPTPTPTPTPAPTPTETPTPAPTEVVTRIVVSLAGGKAEPNGDKVELATGDTVEFVITSDHDDELHIHGMDVEIPVSKGETVVEQITVEQIGRFEFESHHPALVIVQLVVR